MGMPEKLKHELKSLGISFLYFTVWIGGLILIKKLVLEEYHIQFRGWSAALLGALILAKVVLLMEPISLGRWVKAAPAWVGVLLRTLLYSFGVLVVLLLEKGLEGRHEYGGFLAAVKAQFQATRISHILANTVCLSGALLVFNAFDVIHKNMGFGGLLRMFSSPLPKEDNLTGE
jgi:hypothetical protein